MVMRRVVAAFVGLAVMVAATATHAQPPAPDAAADPAPAINPAALGVSIPRIARRLQADATARAQGDAPLKLEYFVDVYGTAPTLRFFTGPELQYGAVPYTAPTHSDMIYQMTPQAFRSPVADLFGLAMAAAKAGVNKVDDWRYQRDLRAYQKLIESGQNRPAPQPPRRY
jgi:hypothetical protein